MELAAPILIPFLIPIAVVFLMIAIQTCLLLVGVGFDFDGDANHDFDLDADVDADVDVGMASHADHGVFDGDFDHDHDFGSWSFAKLFSPLGVGQIPLSIVWEAYFLAFGVTGFTASFVLAKFFTVAYWFLLITIPLALVAGWHLTKFAAKIAVPLLKTSGLAETGQDIVGKTGYVTSLSVNDKWGEARLNINGSTNHMVVVTDEIDLQKGDQIIVVDYDEDKKRPIVNRLKA